MDWIFYYFLYILVRLLVVLRLSFCMRSQRLRAPSEPRQDLEGRLAEGSGGGNPVNNVTYDFWFYAGFLLNEV